MIFCTQSTVGLKNLDKTLYFLQVMATAYENLVKHLHLTAGTIEDM